MNILVNPKVTAKDIRIFINSPNQPLLLPLPVLVQMSTTHDPNKNGQTESSKPHTTVVDNIKKPPINNTQKITESNISFIDYPAIIQRTAMEIQFRRRDMHSLEECISLVNRIGQGPINVNLKIIEQDELINPTKEELPPPPPPLPGYASKRHTMVSPIVNKSFVKMIHKRERQIKEDKKYRDLDFWFNSEEQIQMYDVLLNELVKQLHNRLKAKERKRRRSNTHISEDGYDEESETGCFYEGGENENENDDNDIDINNESESESDSSSDSSDSDNNSDEEDEDNDNFGNSNKEEGYLENGNNTTATTKPLNAYQYYFNTQFERYKEYKNITAKKRQRSSEPNPPQKVVTIGEDEPFSLCGSNNFRIDDNRNSNQEGINNIIKNDNYSDEYYNDDDYDDGSDSDSDSDSDSYDYDDDDDTDYYVTEMKPHGVLGKVKWGLSSISSLLISSIAFNWCFSFSLSDFIIRVILRFVPHHKKSHMRRKLKHKVSRMKVILALFMPILGLFLAVGFIWISATKILVLK